MMADAALIKGMVEMTVPSAGGSQRTLLLPIEFLSGWLFTIKKVRPEVQDKLNVFRAEGFVRFHKESLEFNGQDSPFQRLQLQIIGAVAEFERAMIRERQKEGIALAKAAGKYRGRKPRLDIATINDIRRRLESGEKVAALAREHDISRQTLYDSLRRQDQA